MSAVCSGLAPSSRATGVTRNVEYVSVCAIFCQDARLLWFDERWLRTVVFGCGHGHLRPAPLSVLCLSSYKLKELCLVERGLIHLHMKALS